MANDIRKKTPGLFWIGEREHQESLEGGKKISNESFLSLVIIYYCLKAYINQEGFKA